MRTAIREEAREGLRRARTVPAWYIRVYHDYGLKHICLIAVLVLYLLLGAVVFVSRIPLVWRLIAVSVPLRILERCVEGAHMAGECKEEPNTAGRGDCDQPFQQYRVLVLSNVGANEKRRTLGPLTLQSCA